MAPPGLEGLRRPGAQLVRDVQSCVPLNRILGYGDLLYVFTPAAVPVDPPRPNAVAAEDPFEAFGRALARHHPWVRHVPYTVRSGITEYHVAHIRMAKVVIFVVSGPPLAGQPSQIALSEAARAAGGERPQIILACCSLRELGQVEERFPTVVEIAGYTRSELESAADLLFGRGPVVPLGRAAIQNLIESPQEWRVEEWDLGDLQTVHELWRQCLPSQFKLERYVLQGLLQRSGYSKHFVVRDPATRELLGFCATYTSFIDNSESSWLGSLALIIVKPSCRRRGIGVRLHSHALRQLREHRVSRLQLGSAFPRLLYGLPFELTSEEWFKRRGWRIDLGVPGSGQEACDWILELDQWNSEGLSASGLQFRSCGYGEFDLAMEFVARESGRKDYMGWYDQYSQLHGTPFIPDIILGLEGGKIVATALIYTPKNGSQVAEDLPWAESISGDLDVGGVTCICITDDNLSPAHTRDSVMIRLLDKCVKVLRDDKGMRKMFLDAVKGGYEGFQSLGFQKWARYRDVWHDAREG